MLKLQTLRIAQEHLAEMGVAPTTKSTRLAQSKRYGRFCRKLQLVSYPCSSNQACIYATYLHEEGFAPVSVRNYVSGLWYHQKMLGMPDFSSDFILKQTLNGIERQLDPSLRVSRYPFSPLDLLRIHALLNFNDINDVLFWVAVVIGFRCLLRACHMTASQHNIGAAHLKMKDGYIRIEILTSKTNQFGREKFSVFLQDMPGSPWCIRQLIIDLLQDSSPDDPLICRRVGKICFPLTYDELYFRIKSFAFLLGLPADRVSTHSLRHGGSTLLQDLGMPVASIMKKGNWRSSAVRRYLHQSAKELAVLEHTPCDYLKSFNPLG